MNYLEEFLDFCQYQRSLSENTIKGYRWDLKQYFAWLQEKGLGVTTVKVFDIDSFIISQRKEGKAIKSVNRKISCLRAFYRWFLRIEAIEKNPVELVQCVKGPKRLPKFLTQGQQEVLIKAAQSIHHHSKWGGPHTPWELWLETRDLLMILLLLDTGLRISELCGIKRDDIDLEAGTIRIIGKGDKERRAILSDRCISLLREALKIRLKGSDFLLVNSHTNCLGTRHAFRLVQNLGKRVGISNLHPHMLRHSYATNLRRKGGDLLLIRDALGHSSVSSTEIYAHLDETEYGSKLRELIN
ncbi:MAG: tyrosine-type recombinase/integrase [Thermodesulfobacteriota bacterium]|jgi:site-specific recombinase XerD